MISMFKELSIDNAIALAQLALTQLMENNETVDCRILGLYMYVLFDICRLDAINGKFELDI